MNVTILTLPSQAEHVASALSNIARGWDVRAGDFLIRHGRTYRIRRVYPDLDLDELASFAAFVVAEQLEAAGQQFLIRGNASDGTPFPETWVPARTFPLMRWPLERWGARAIVSAGKGRHLAEAILRLSAGVAEGER